MKTKKKEYPMTLEISCLTTKIKNILFSLLMMRNAHICAYSWKKLIY